MKLLSFEVKPHCTDVVGSAVFLMLNQYKKSKEYREQWDRIIERSNLIYEIDELRDKA